MKQSTLSDVWLALLLVAAFFFMMKLTHFYGDSLFGRLASGSQTVGMLMLWIWLLRRTLRLRRAVPSTDGELHARPA